jgi:hypothetical protein
LVIKSNTGGFKMVKKVIIGTIAVFVAWMVLDALIHQVILGAAYKATAELWRPMEEMKNVLMVIVVLISAVVFVYIYAEFVAKKSMNTAIKYGIIFGIGVGISMGYGTYAVMDIPYFMALTWFLGTVVETTLGGMLLGIIVKE